MMCLHDGLVFVIAVFMFVIAVVVFAVFVVGKRRMRTLLRILVHALISFLETSPSMTSLSEAWPITPDLSGMLGLLMSLTEWW